MQWARKSNGLPRRIFCARRGRADFRHGDALDPAPRPTWLARLWRDYSLSIVVGALFAASFILHTAFAWLQYPADQADQGSAATLFGLHGFVTYFGEWTFQNWQSEFLEVLLLIVLTSHLVHNGSPEFEGWDEGAA